MNDKNKNENIRLDWIDMAKGIGIILVVLGHVITRCGQGQAELYLLRIIYLFHIPLFFFLSGYTFSDRDSIKSFFVKKFKRLIIPAYIYTFLYALFRSAIMHTGLDASCSLQDYYHILVLDSESKLSEFWFLPVLFSAIVVFRFLHKNIYALLAGAIGGVVINRFLWFYGIVLPYGLREAFLVLPFIICGYSVKQYNTRFNPVKVILAIILAIVGGVMWIRDGYKLMNIYNSDINNVFLFYVLGLTLTLLAVGMIQTVNKLNIHNNLKLIRRTGIESLHIYCIHYFILDSVAELVNNSIFPRIPLLSVTIVSLAIVALILSIIVLVRLLAKHMPSMAKQ